MTDATARRGRREMHNVLVGIDFQPGSDLALETAFELARSRDGLVLHAVHVGDPGLLPSKLSGNEASATLSRIAERLAERLERHVADRTNAHSRRAGRPPPARVAVHVLFGQVAQEIVELASRLDAELIVVGGRSRRGMRARSSIEDIVCAAGCTVQVVRMRRHRGVAHPSPRALQEIGSMLRSSASGGIAPTLASQR